LKEGAFMQKQRRDFLKISAAGAAGLALIRADRAHAAWPGTGTLAVNENISNMRVVSCVDTQMMSTPKGMTFDTENAAVDACRVHANMDAMAMQLANKTTADDAWRTIFRSSKPWASTLVAIKVNVIEPKNMARIAIVEKFCTVLASFGVPPANIIVYDGNTTYGAGLSSYNSYFSLTDTTKIQAVVSGANSAALGGTTSASLPDGTTATCTKQIADGTVDILINIANNKGHNMFGGSTLSMKNHFGTFAPNHTNLASYVFNINKSDAILGGTYPRQQLCFIDSLLAIKTNNNMGTPDVMPCYLIMGVFGPAVDYLTVKKVREEVMGSTHDATTVNSFLTSFGYTTADPVWVVVPPATAACGTDGGTISDANVGNGGSSGTGGSGSGGKQETGGSSGGGATGAGGTGKGGTTGSSAMGGNLGTGGKSSTSGVGSGGSGSGGVSTSGGSGSGDVPSSGGASSTSSGLGGAGGAGTSIALGSGGVGAGGTTARSGTASSSGCSVGLGGISRGAGPWSVMFAFGAVMAGMLRRLVVRRDACAKDGCATDGASESEVVQAKKPSDESMP